MNEELLLKLLEYVVEQDRELIDAPDLSPQFSKQEVHGHIGYCADKNWLEVKDITGASQKHRHYYIKRITAFGHEKLASLKSHQQFQQKNPPRKMGFGRAEK